jgi:DNA-binding HxlR family transcriptional regulator
MAERTSFEDFACSTAQALEIVGEWWTLLIVRDAFFGVRRFEDFQRRLGLSRSVLAGRLAGLVDHGILETRAYETRPPRVEYLLTRKGLDLFPVLIALQQWGDRWASPKPPVVLRHRSCGRRTKAHVVCSVCGDQLRAEDVIAEPGPGGTDPNMLPPVRRLSPGTRAQ